MVLGSVSGIGKTLRPTYQYEGFSSGGKKTGSPVFMGADMRRVSALGNHTGIRKGRSVGVELLLAVCLVVVSALAAVEARVGLSADTNTLAGLDLGDLWSDSEGLSDDF